MQKAKQAVSNFISSDGKHTTTVDESVQQAVTNENVRPHKHENVIGALDKEVHQDHHHTVVQPIQAEETLPEKHTHNMLPVEHKTIDHRNEQGIRDKLNSEAAQFKNTSTVHEATHSSSIAATATGEHVHHHVHEHIQPVIQKETVQPEYIHTTVPVHEVHHAEAKHHGTSVLPPITMKEFEGNKKSKLEGQAERRVEEFEGCPRTYEKKLQTERTPADENMHAQVV